MGSSVHYNHRSDCIEKSEFIASPKQLNGGTYLISVVYMAFFTNRKKGGWEVRSGSPFIPSTVRVKLADSTNFFLEFSKKKIIEFTRVLLRSKIVHCYKEKGTAIVWEYTVFIHYRSRK